MYNNVQNEHQGRYFGTAGEARMKLVSFSEFRRNAASLLDAVEQGETIRVLRHGKPIAEIIPLRAAASTTLSWKRPGLYIDLGGRSLSREILRERARSERPAKCGARRRRTPR